MHAYGMKEAPKHHDMRVVIWLEAHNRWTGRLQLFRIVFTLHGKWQLELKRSLNMNWETE